MATANNFCVLCGKTVVVSERRVLNSPATSDILPNVRSVLLWPAISIAMFLHVFISCHMTTFCGANKLKYTIVPDPPRPSFNHRGGAGNETNSYVDHGTEGCHPRTALLRRFLIHRKSRLHRMRPTAWQ